MTIPEINGFASGFANVAATRLHYWLGGEVRR
jgi:hypothetical protein